LKIQVPQKFYPMFKPKRIKVFYGGRGGAKTESFIRVGLVKASAEGKRFLCMREFMNSIDDSVHAAIKAIIESDGLQGFEVFNNRIEGPKGSVFKYAQLARNLSSIKSKYGFDVAWVEEAETVSEESIDYLEPTIRADGSELWYSFNPVREDGAVYSRYVLPHIDQINAHGFYEDDDLYVCKVGMEDNPWAPEELVRASAKMKVENYDHWAHIWGGEPRRDLDDVVIQPKWIEASIDAHKKKGFKAMGIRVLGFDPADIGDDAKAIALRHGSVVENVEQWSKGDVSDAIDRAFGLAFDLRADHIVYDSIGVGAAIKVGLDKRIEGKGISVTGFGAGDRVDYPTEKYNDDRPNAHVFKNKKAQYWWYLRDRFEKTYMAVEKGMYINPDEMISLSSEIKDLKQLKAELSRIERKRGANSYIQLESKPEMKKRGVNSPNMADALVMAFANPPPQKKMRELNFKSEW